MTSVSRPLRIALLTHSTNPRGGVVHAMELASALHRLGHVPVLHAPASDGGGFFRSVPCEARVVPARSVSGGLAEMVTQRVSEYVAYFSDPRTPEFDIYHAQDPISANALADLRELGLISGYIRTVHHVDSHNCARLQHMQDRAIKTAQRVLCVSNVWKQRLAETYGVEATLIPSGVDTDRFCPVSDESDARLRQRLGISGAGPVFLSVGGIEPRKNSIGILRAFSHVLRKKPDAQLVIAGGATLLDHSTYRGAFDSVLRELAIPSGPGCPLIFCGRVEDREMPALFRIASALLFPSLVEGFGLVVLEAMASGTPVIVSQIAPFTEYLNDDCCLWVDPTTNERIADAMLDVLKPSVSQRLSVNAYAASKCFSWNKAAEVHSEIYCQQLAA